MIKSEQKVCTYVKDIAISGTCDNCGASIEKKEDNLYDYFRTITHHNDWGVDSSDSCEAKEFCCWACLMNGIEKYWKSDYPYRSDSREMKILHLSTLSVY